MKDSAPSPRRLQYLRDYRRRKRSIRLWQVCLLAGLFALWELTTRLGLSDGFLTSSHSIWLRLAPRERMSRSFSGSVVIKP